VSKGVECLIRHLVNGKGKEYHREYIFYQRRLSKVPDNEKRKLDTDFNNLLIELEQMLKD